MICSDNYPIKVGKDLDDYMIDKVMHTITDWGNGNKTKWGDGNAKYSTDMGWAMRVVKKLEQIYMPEDEDGNMMTVGRCISEGFSGYIVNLFGGEGWGTTIPHAICLAALDALRTFDGPNYMAVPDEPNKARK